MTREEFIEVLDKKGYSYEIEGDNIVVTRKRHVNLESLPSLPPDVVFNNGGNVYLESLTSLPPGVEFNNGDGVWLDSLTSLPPGMEFNNGGAVYLGSLFGVEGWFSDWQGNIEGIDSKRLLNVMIKRGMFI